MGIGNGIGTRGHIFYGWWIVLAGFIIIVIGVGAYGYMQSLLPSLVRDEFSGGAQSLGLAMAIPGLAGGIALLISGPFIDRFGPRRLMLIVISLAGVGFLGMSISKGLLMLDFFGALIGIGLGAGFLLPVQTATASWFIRRRSFALAIISAAVVLGVPLLSFVGSYLSGQFSWRGAFLGLGLAMLVIGIPLALIIRNRPEDYGYLPDGEQPKASEGNVETVGQKARVAEVNFTLREALRTRTFWLLAVAGGLGSGLAMVISSHTRLYWIDQGFTVEGIQSILALIPVAGLVGILIFGYIGDLFSKRYLLALAAISQSISVFILLIAGNIVLMYYFLLIFGLGSGTIPLLFAIRADYFGRRAFATITVAMMLVSGTIGTLLPALFGFFGVWASRASGGNQLFLLLLILAGFIPATLFLFAKPPKQPEGRSVRI